jgi:hypothetical protein
MKNFILSFLLFIVVGANAYAKEHDPNPGTVYVLIGGDLPIFSWDTAVKLASYARNELGGVAHVYWHYAYKKACRNIANDPNRGKVVLIGHSFGGSAVVELARCLQRKNTDVDLLINIDTQPRLLAYRRHVNLIPDNVKVNFNFFEKHDICFPIVKRNSRVSTPVNDLSSDHEVSEVNANQEKTTERVDQRGIFNVEVYGMPVLLAHIGIDNYTRPIVSILMEKAFQDRLSDVPIKNGSRYKALNQKPEKHPNAVPDLVQLCMSLGKDQRFCTVHLPVLP